MYSHFSSLFALFSLAKNRIGFYTRGDDAKLGIFTHMMFFNVNAPISRVYLQMAYLLGAQVKDYHLENFNTTLQETGNKKYIVINPNASDLRLERRWPMENFMYIIQNFTKYYPEYNICLIGSASEKEYVDQLLSGKTFSQVINLAGKTSFDQLLTLIKNAELVISNDTGPMHLAFALEKSVLALFGPCSPKQYSIFSTSVKVFYKSVYCSPCVHEFLVPPCKGNNICMQIISKEEVFMAVVEFMSKGKFEETLFNGEEIIYESSNQTIGLIKTQKR
ncbi:MAG: glycosyltransferase family 9 protein [Saprospiraceae bacterium]|nr:glycosyltransferase family 9 protein [Saprospiraceae bacterium]